MEDYKIIKDVYKNKTHSTNYLIGYYVKIRYNDTEHDICVLNVSKEKDRFGIYYELEGDNEWYH